MSSQLRICADIRCPYFTSITEKSIRCEGVEYGIGNTMRFDSASIKNDYIERFCVHFPNDCVICKAAAAKYENA